MIGNAIKELREERGWSQDELARSADTTQSSISKLERGEVKEYSERLLGAVAEALGVKVYELFALAEGIELARMERLTAEERRLLQDFRHLGKSQRTMVRTVVQTLRKPKAGA